MNLTRLKNTLSALKRERDVLVQIDDRLYELEDGCWTEPDRIILKTKPIVREEHHVGT